jgi:two-component system sensor histidine kinase DesK
VGFAFLLPYLIPTVQKAFHQDMPLWQRVLVLASMTLYSLGYLFFPKVMFGRAHRNDLIFCVGILAAGLAQLLILGGGSVGLMAYSMALVAIAMPSGWVVILDGATALLILIFLWIEGRISDTFGDLVTVIAIAVALFFMGRLIRAVRVLRRAQDEIAVLAVANERERVARDLHDILGHSLTTITVKAGLARRILESSDNVSGAISELRDVENLTRSALSDVRATVSEYREVSLVAELAGARAALRAAQINADLPSAVDNVRPELQGVFGYVLREAVTNVIRHSGANSVNVRVGRSWLVVEDDGEAAGQVREGNGLLGLSERLEAVGGALTVVTKTGGGFVVRAEVPRSETPAEQGKNDGVSAKTSIPRTT